MPLLRYLMGQCRTQSQFSIHFLLPLITSRLPITLDMKWEQMQATLPLVSFLWKWHPSLSKKDMQFRPMYSQHKPMSLVHLNFYLNMGYIKIYINSKINRLRYNFSALCRLRFFSEKKNNNQKLHTQTINRIFMASVETINPFTIGINCNIR